MQFFFPVSRKNEEFMKTPISTLFDGNKETFVLHRNGCFRICDFLDKYTSENDLLKLRNCGMVTANKIMQAIFNLYVSLLDDDEVVKYYIYLATLNPEIKNLNFKVTE